MLFTDIRFVLAFAILYFAYWFGLRRQSLRKGLLLASSYLFYAAWDWRFLGLILATTTVDFVAGLLMERSPSRKGVVLAVSLLCDLGILGFFKYYNFFVSTFDALLERFGVAMRIAHLDVILPIGISFYTFRTINYTVDVYRGKLKATRNPLDFALFVAFFPQLVAGPIARATEFLPGLRLPKRLEDVHFRVALLLFLTGFVKKAVLSDGVASTVDALFARPGDYSALSTHVGVLLYALQIYCDFSGYSDMANATAMLLGYPLIDNFRFPYSSENITDFWRRWHISLSGWLRDYLYIPLGGNRRGRVRQLVNLMVTMLLAGLWHGAGVTFILWGGLHGLGLAAHRIWSSAVPRSGRGLVERLVCVVSTFYFVAACWILFRADSLAVARDVFRQFLFVGPAGTKHISPIWLLTMLALPAERLYSARYLTPVAPIRRRLPDWAFAMLYGAAVAIALLFVQRSTRSFIYFQF